MSSRVFKAQTSHSPENPQLCGLTAAHIIKGDWCFYLVCDGSQAKPNWQVCMVDEIEYEDRRGVTRKRKVYESKEAGRPFFCVWTGEWETYTKTNGKKGRRRVYEWQVEDDQGNRFPVDVWSNMVHASAAEELGFSVLRDAKGNYRITTAYEGDRTEGNEHRIAEDAESPLVTLAKAALDDEEAGLVAPSPESKEVTF